jgi:bifunctional non-homologous end joining protein LigD
MTNNGAGSRVVKLSTLDKVLFPSEGITKREVIEYYEQIASVMLPHIENRPLMLQRFPNGIEAEGFYQKNVSETFPRWIKRVSVDKAGGHVTHAVCNDKETLVYLANLGCITPHMWLSRTPKIKNPDILIFDLDPTEDDFRTVRDMAIGLRDILTALGLKSFPMTTGSRGLHVSVPLDQAVDFGFVRAFATDVAHGLVDAFPDVVTMAQRKTNRKGRLFIDVMRNAYAQTAVAPYSLRAKPGAPVAFPLTWDELADPKLHSQRYNIRTVLRHVHEHGDAWKRFWEHPQSLKQARKTIDGWIPEEKWRAA